MKSAIVLLSSGLDSTVNLYCALREYKVLKTLTFDYGQRSATKEIERSRKISESVGVEHKVIELPWLGEVTQTSLVNRSANVPTGDDIKIDDYNQSTKTARSVWVPNRNGVFLSIAAAIAEGLGSQYIVPGFNREEAATFPDNSGEFIRAVNLSFSFSTANSIEVKCFTIDKNKTEIVTLGRELNAPFDLMWSCYFAGETACGQCESCLRFNRAISVQSISLEKRNEV